MTSRSKNLGSAVVVAILLRVTLRQTCAAEAAGRPIETHLANQDYWSPGFDLSPMTLEVDPERAHPFHDRPATLCARLQPSHALTLKLGYGISPSDVDAGAGVVDQRNVEQVIQWTAAGDR